MKTLIALAAALLLASPAVAGSTTACPEDLPGIEDMDVIEALSEDQYDVQYIPEEYIGSAQLVAENITGERYGKVYQVIVVERPEADVVVLFDVGGCIIQVETDPDTF